MISDRIDLNNWQDADILTDDLWLFPNRDNNGKHKNIYHGNFIPQIPYQLISRYTRKNEVVLDAFFGSGTTLFECEKLGRKFIGLDINPKIFEYVKERMNESDKSFFALNLCDNTNEESKNLIKNSLEFLGEEKVSFAIFHPPYHNIVKFTDNKNDLSNCQSIDEFINKFQKTISNSLAFLEKNRYFAIVIGDIYQKSEVVPLSFLCMNMVKSKFKVKLKGIIVKNIEGNRGNREYGANYHILNTIALYDDFIPRGKTGLRYYKKSLWCKKSSAAYAFEDLIKNAEFKYIFLSYNNEGIISPTQISQICKKFGKYEQFSKTYRRFKADNNRNQRAEQTVEYLHFLEK